MAAPQLPFIFLISRQGTRETGLPEKAPPPLPSPPPNQKERAEVTTILFLRHFVPRYSIISAFFTFTYLVFVV